MRLINAVREWNAEGRPPLRVIAVYTAADRRATFVREADEAVLIGPADPGEAFAASPYLDYAELERALRACRADAVWPGWGFVSEKAEFAELCERLGITFIGPSADVMRRLGDKIESKRLAEEVGVPLAAWSGGPVANLSEAQAAAESIGYPLMVKATAGGGGRGIRLVRSAEQLDEAFERASSEASKTAGDATVFLERAIRGGHHVEVQVVADAKGTVWTLGVRDCSVQRRNQKVIEESASTALPAEQEKMVRAHAADLIRAAGYVNAATVEFLYEPGERLLSFLEVNTRLQVEHPVTEATTGLDIVKLQLHIAAGGALAEIGALLDEVTGEPPVYGHAIEARLTAEDPERDFAPAPGLIEHLALPAGPGIRVDSRGLGGRCHPAAVRLDDRQGDRLGPGPGRGPRAAVPRAPADRRGDQGRDHEQGLPARPAGPAGVRPWRGRHDLAGHDDGRRLRPAAAGRRRAAGHRLRGLPGVRPRPAGPAVHLRRARAPGGRPRDVASGRRPRRLRGLPVPGVPAPAGTVPGAARRPRGAGRRRAVGPVRAHPRRRRSALRRPLGRAGPGLPDRGRRSGTPDLRRRGGAGPRAGPGHGGGHNGRRRRRGRGGRRRGHRGEHEAGDGVARPGGGPGRRGARRRQHPGRDGRQAGQDRAGSGTAGRWRPRVRCPGRPERAGRRGRRRTRPGGWPPPTRWRPCAPWCSASTSTGTRPDGS